MPKDKVTELGTKGEFGTVRKRLFSKDVLLRQVFLVIADILTVIAASSMALWVRFDFSVAKIDLQYLEYIWAGMIPNIIGVIVIYWFFHLYRSVWKYAGLYELQHILFAGVTSTLVQLFG